MANDKEKKVIRYRRWCMTCFDMDKYPNKQSLADDICKHEIKFLIIGLEKTKNDKPHYQVYWEYKNARSWDAIHKDFPKIRVVEAKGSCNDNIDYCSKEDDNPLKIGTPNISDSAFVLSKDDIASNLINYFMTLEKQPKLYDIIADFPQFADYIVKNYNTIKLILADIFADRKHYTWHPQQQAIELDDDLPFNNDV